MKGKIHDGEKIVLWIFLLVAVIAFVIMGFPQTPEVDRALNPEPEELEEAKIYDVPLDHELQLHISKLCDDYELDMPLVLAVIGQESNYNPNALGDNGNSMGLMQIQPRWHTERMEKLGVTDLMNPFQNVTVGIDLLAELLNDGSVEWAITAYNAGAERADFNRNVGIVNEYTESVLKLREIIVHEN